MDCRFLSSEASEFGLNFLRSCFLKRVGRLQIILYAVCRGLAGIIGLMFSHLLKACVILHENLTCDSYSLLMVKTTDCTLKYSKEGSFQSGGKEIY
jgi:hypothetical protein